jgi:hypothetical protein
MELTAYARKVQSFLKTALLLLAVCRLRRFIGFYCTAPAQPSDTQPGGFIIA